MPQNPTQVISYPLSQPFTTLAAATVAGAWPTGEGKVDSFYTARNYISMQVSWTSNPTDVEVELWGSVDGTNFGLLQTFQGGSGGALASGSIIVSAGFPVIAAVANLKTLTGGTSSTVTATILGY